MAGAGKPGIIVWRGGYQKTLLENAVTALCTLMVVVAGLFALEQAFYPPVIYPAGMYQSCDSPVLFERSHITQSMTDPPVPSMPVVVDQCEQVDKAHDFRAAGAAVIAMAALVIRRRVESRASKRGRPRAFRAAGSPPDHPRQLPDSRKQDFTTS